MTVREESVLRPRKASIKDPNEWPQYDLKLVTITSLKTGNNASLLSASQENPLNVCGKLSPIDDNLNHLGKLSGPIGEEYSLMAFVKVRDKTHVKDYIVIEHVTLYSFAEYDDGTYGFWAAGKAGWFGIESPSGSFRPTFDQMKEAASIFYLLADKWRRSSVTASTLDQKGLKKYASKIFNAVGRNAFGSGIAG